MMKQRKGPLVTTPEILAQRASEVAAEAVVKAAGDFVQAWLEHPRNDDRVGPLHAELVRAVLNNRAAMKARFDAVRSILEPAAYRRNRRK